MRRTRYSIDTVAVVNGYNIVRWRVGAGVWWQAVKLDNEGYQLARSDDLPTRRDAEKFAASH